MHLIPDRPTITKFSQVRISSTQGTHLLRRVCTSHARAFAALLICVRGISTGSCGQVLSTGQAGCCVGRAPVTMLIIIHLQPQGNRASEVEGGHGCPAGRRWQSARTITRLRIAEVAAEGGPPDLASHARPAPEDADVEAH
jgi:hypothetical protein